MCFKKTEIMKTIQQVLIDHNEGKPKNIAEDLHIGEIVRKG